MRILPPLLTTGPPVCVIIKGPQHQDQCHHHCNFPRDLLFKKSLPEALLCFQNAMRMQRAGAEVPKNAAKRRLCIPGILTAPLKDGTTVEVGRP